MIVNNYFGWSCRTRVAAFGQSTQGVAYTATGRLATLNEGGNFSWEYLPGTHLKAKLTYPNGITAAWLYESSRELLTRVTNALPDGTAISTYMYTNDSLDRRTAKNDEAYDYNSRDELTSADAVAFAYDDIGNRTTAEGKIYTANALNQYTAVDTFVPEYDADGNQTKIQTATGVWTVAYNAENRPVRWTQGTKVITMTFDRMGRRVAYVEKNGETIVKHDRFVYDNYLCIQRLDAMQNNSVRTRFVWDPTEPLATRPLFMRAENWNLNLFYSHDGNKNVSEVFYYANQNGIAAHYDYAPFGAVIRTARNTRVTNRDIVSENPFRFSSEFHDDALALVYYNYRHYNSQLGRWVRRDPIGEKSLLNLYSFTSATVYEIDILGLVKYLCILSNVSGQKRGGFLDGHALLLYLEIDPSTTAIKGSTYGLWPDEHPGIIAAGLNNPTASDVRTNFSGDAPRNYGYIHCREITDEMECKLKCILEQNHEWRYTNNCASFASETFEEVTGVDIDADDWFGFETPREIGDSILQGNGGLPSNIRAIPYAPGHRNSSNFSKAK